MVFRQGRLMVLNHNNGIVFGVGRPVPCFVKGGAILANSLSGTDPRIHNSPLTYPLQFATSQDPREGIVS